MNTWYDAFIVGVALLNLMLLSSSRLAACVRLVSFQGIAVGLLPLMTNQYPPLGKIFFLAVIIITLKGFIFPWFLLQALREVNVHREVEPLVGYVISMVVGILGLIIALWVSHRLPLPTENFSSLAAPVAFATIFAGLFMIVSRTKALTQVVGYLMMENGIYIFGIAFLLEQSFLIEVGILLDVFVAVFVMGIIIFHISREFDHIDTDQMAQLRDWMPADVDTSEKKVRP